MRMMKKNKRFFCIAIAMIMLSGCGTTNTIPVEEFSEQQVEAISELVTSKAYDIEVTDVIEELTEMSTEEAEEITEQKDNQIELIMVGDVLLHTRVYESGLMEDGTYQYDHLFANTKDKIESADLALVNQEVILGGRELGLSGYPCFNGAYEVGDSLVDAGFDVILHATNHALDKGKKGLLNCIHFWKEQYPEIGVVGIHETEEESDDIYVVEVNDIRIAILNYTYGTNGISLPTDMPFAVELWDETQIALDVAMAKEMSDFVVVCPHWGTEYVLTQTKDQEKKAQFLADLGVDLIIGTHPHVIEPVAWITGKDGNQTLCYYSIGNFINATSGTGKGAADRMVGAMADVILEKVEDDVVITDYEVLPLVTHLVEGREKITTYFLSDYTEELEKQNQMISQDSSFSLEYCKELCRKVFGEKYEE